VKLPKPPCPVLLVDDFSAMRRIIRILLEEIGCNEVIEADDGKAALQVLKDKEVSLIIADWTMPRTSGLELLKTVRGDKRWQKMPFLVMMTMEEENEEGNIAAEHGAAVIIKPFLAQELGQVLAKMF